MGLNLTNSRFSVAKTSSRGQYSVRLIHCSSKQQIDSIMHSDLSQLHFIAACRAQNLVLAI